MGGGVSTPGVGNSGPLRTCDAWVFLFAVRDNLCCAPPFAPGGSGPCAVILAAGADGTCTRSNLASVTSAGGTGTIGGITAGDGADESATPGVSTDTGLSGRGIIDTARNARAKPAGTDIQPAHPAAAIMRRTNCWSRDLGRGSAGGGGASPCQSHKPASLISVLTNAAEGEIGGVPLTIGALLYAWSISSPVSACMAHIPLLVATPISRVHSVRHPRTGSGRIGLQSPHLVGDGHTDKTVFWRGASATETIMVSK